MRFTCPIEMNRALVARDMRTMAGFEITEITICGTDIVKSGSPDVAQPS